MIGGQGFGFFVVNVDLTEDGIQHIDDIITLIFQVNLKLALFFGMELYIILILFLDQIIWFEPIEFNFFLTRMISVYVFML